MDDARVVLVTGAGRDIGAAVARRFGAEGCTVAVHHRGDDTAGRAVLTDVRAAGGDGFLVHGDLTIAGLAGELVGATVERAGRLDVLVNNAGGLVRRAPIEDTDDELLEAIVAINLLAVVRACRSAAAVFRDQGHGTIVNVSSTAARTGGGGDVAVYAACKGAVSTLTRALARELAGVGVRVNAIAPGLIDTAFHADPTRLRDRAQAVPLGRVGTPEDCAEAVAYLADPRRSAYVTGQVLEVNGGLLMP